MTPGQAFFIAYCVELLGKTEEQARLEWDGHWQEELGIHSKAEFEAAAKKMQELLK